MNDKSLIIALVVLVAILVIAYWAYDNCKLNKYLSAKHQKKCSPSGSGGGSFVGAMAQNPALGPSAFPSSAGTGVWQMDRYNYA
jgi:hypothetical protein